MINYISKQKYLDKINDEVIDGKEYRYDHRFTINRYLNRQLRSTATFLDVNPIINKLKDIPNHYCDYLKLYDHMQDCRIVIPGVESPKTLRCTFSFPYNEPDKVKNYANKPYVDQNYQIYLVNPRLFKYYKKETVSLAHVLDVDDKYFEGRTELFVKLINGDMITVTGEPLFYKLV